MTDLPNDAGYLRGFPRRQGACKDLTPINLYDLHLKAGHHAALTLPAGYNTAIFLLKGNIGLHDSRSLKEAELALFDVDGERISIDGKEDATLLVLNGEPIHEPIARHGPFVMNTEGELMPAANNYQAGKMGHL